MSRDLTPRKARIFRIVHRANLPWILDNGLHCRNSDLVDPGYIPIGNPELIEKRSTRAIPRPPFGTLSDYIPFYFTPFSPMMMNIKTGYGGIQRRRNADVVILVSSLHRLNEEGIQWLFADRHAYLQIAEFYDSVDNLNVIDWQMLQERNFRRDPNQPDRFERYQAEALVYKHLPTHALLGVACYDEASCTEIKEHLLQRGSAVRVKALPQWYF